MRTLPPLRCLASLSLAMALIALGAGCAGAGFGQAERDAVTARMTTLQEPLSACYAQALQRNRNLAATVTARFVAEARTGRFKDVQLQGTTGDGELDRCVTDRIAGLVLTPATKTNLAITYPIQFAARD